MPELPEVETVRRGLLPVLQGAVIEAAEARRPDLRWPLPEGFSERLAGRRVEAVGRRAKYLLADLDGGEVLILHLGMSGSIRIEGWTGARAPGTFHHPRGAPGPHDHVVLHLAGGTTVTFNDPRRFGAILLVPYDRLDSHPLLKTLGPEPLGNQFNAAYLAKACAGKKTSLKAALLDQKIVAGLGNIYVCEALHRAGLSPRRLASTLATKAGAPAERTERLVTAIRDVLRRPFRRAAPACGTTGRWTGSSAISSTASASMTGKAPPAPPIAAPARWSASCRAAAPPSSAPPASVDRPQARAPAGCLC